MKSFWAVTVLTSCAFAQSTSTPARPRLAGLLDFPSIYSEANPGTAGTVLEVHERPAASSPLVARLDLKGIRAQSGEYACTWRRDLDSGEEPMGCIFTESGYEVPAVVVLEQATGWYRIALDPAATRTGWVQSSAEYHSLAKLLAGSEHLSHLTKDWDGRLYQQPGLAPRLVRPAGSHSEIPYRALDHRSYQGRLWIKVELLDEVCGEHEPRVLHTGWVPAQSAEGKLWAWFWSRGC